ncbi:MAG: cyclic nucleotide-binding domain-containing protein [Spirochaetaceae bacterium]|jgi:CRP-like cAMP-binding protein|nr:cyclic nucleotide-binding domain-containing protein [Spirochaetaceae bacterium]
MGDTFSINVLTFKRDSYIIVEGKEDNRFFIIKEGKVLLSRENEVVRERDGAVLQPGDFFGVVSALSQHPQIETVRALTDVSLIAVPDSDFDDFIQLNTQVAMNIITQFSSRIRYLNKAFTQRTLNDTSETDEPDHLFDIGKYYDKTENFSHAFYAYRQYLRHCPEGANVAEAQARLDAVKQYAKSIPFTTDGNKRIYAADTVLYAQGEPASELYVIQSGAVKISKIVNNNEVILATLRAGDILGEMAILESKPRSVTAVTVEVTSLISINKANFANIVDTNPQIVGHLVKSLAERIWFTYRQLSNTHLMDPIARIYDVLLIQLEKAKVPLDLDGAYSFDFGLQDLISLVGIPESDVDKTFLKFTANPNIKIINDKIYAEQVAALTKEANYYKSVDGRKKAFLQSKDNKPIEIPKITKPGDNDSSQL